MAEPATLRLEAPVRACYAYCAAVLRVLYRRAARTVLSCRLCLQVLRRSETSFLLLEKVDLQEALEARSHAKCQHTKC